VNHFFVKYFQNGTCNLHKTFDANKVASALIYLRKSSLI